jgi:hypothetical protein
MSDTGDAQDVAEALDPDVLPDYDDPEGTLQYPPDRPTGVNQYGTTAAEERVDEPLDERRRRELPDVDETDVEVDTTIAGRLIAPGADDPVLADDEPEAIGSAAQEPDLSAEEAAVHVVDDTEYSED